MLVAFGVDHAGVIGQRGYSIEEQGKPPDFVLEVASVTTGQNDYTQKRDDYAAFGVPEYWRFDPSGGEYHDATLAGDHLVDGVYQPIEVVRFGETTYRGHSAVLGLDLCWEDGQLPFQPPSVGSLGGLLFVILHKGGACQLSLFGSILPAFRSVRVSHKAGDVQAVG